MPINTDPHVHNLVMCANIFVRKDGKYLLLRRSSHKKYAPNVVHPIGGKVDPGENPFMSAQRELLEEARVTVKNMRLEAVILEITPVKGKDENWLIFHFSADYDSGEVKETEEGELVYFTADEISRQDLFPSVRQVIHHILNPHDGTVFATISYDEHGDVVEEQKRIDVCVV